MLRPPRRKKRFQGHAEATGATSLSNPSEEADGRKKRRRMALAAAGCALMIALIIALTVGGKKDASSASGPSGSQAASLDAYELTSHAALDQVQSDVEFYKHKKSGLQVMTMIPKDTTQDATFGISFRTPPNSDRGVAQVVRNSILSGSEKYPVKDPFNQLKRGSLQTFLDSWTGKDRTAFAVASRNKADFGNAIKVFLDGVFHPLMANGVNHWIFRQAGWRLEVTNNSVLHISGNAFNEAKAVAMYPASNMKNFLYKKLFPDNAYGYNAHGDTADVVSLDETEVMSYYRAHYHPSNGQAFCYGPRDYVDQCLDLLDSVVSYFDEDIQLRTKSKVGWQELMKLEEPHEAVAYPSYQNSTDFRYAESWVLNDQNMDSRTEVAWFLISDLLVGSPAALLSKEVANLNLGDDVIGGLDHTLQQWTFTVGVSGISDEDKVSVAQDAIRNLLLKTAEEGFSDEAMKASLNKVDMNLREQSGGDEPLGVKHFRAIINKWTYDFDAKLPLLYSKVFSQLKEGIEKDGQGFILELMTKFLVDNNHKTEVEMFPSVNLAIEWENREVVWLENLSNYYDTQAERMALMNETSQLHNVQNTQDTEEALSKIPRVSISDLNKTSFEIPVNEVRDIFDSGLTMLEHQLPHTNGIVYVDFAIDISNMDFDDVVLLPLFCRLMLEGGTDRKNDVQFQRDIETYTGGIEVFPVVDEIIETNSDGSYIVPDGKHLVTKIVVRTSCLAATGGSPMFSLIKQIIFDTDVRNEEQAKDIMQRLMDDMEDDIQTNGHKYTSLRILSRYSLPGFLAEQWKGITQLMNLRRAFYQSQNQNDFETLGKRLILMQDAMKRGNRNGMLLSVTGDHDAIKDISGGIATFVKDVLPPAAQVTRFPDFAKTIHPWVTKGLARLEAEVDAEDPNEAFIVPTRVNHVGKGGILFDVGEPLGGEDAVVMQFLGGYYLYDRVRFNLGAAEAWSLLDADSGTVVYQSDSDPNIAQTLQVYEKGASWLWEQLDGKSELPVEAKSAVVGTIGSIDGTALQPSQAGYISMLQYLKQDKQAYRQKYRDQVLAAKPEDFIKMVERLGSWGKPSIVVVTNMEEYNRAQAYGRAHNKDYNMTICDYADYSCSG